MTETHISEGEAADFRTRLGAAERRMTDTEIRVNVHEQKCASRYQQIMVLLAISIAIQVPSALPHLLGWLTFMR